MHAGLGFAFVLKVSNKTSKVVLLDKEHGKLELYSKKRIAIYNGLLIKFEANGRALNLVDLYPIHFKFNKSQLKFYHLVLEICENFIPPGLESPDIFELLRFLYFSFDSFDSNFSQKLFLHRLFSKIGIGSGNKKFSALSNLLLNPIDRIVQQPLDLETEERLNSFIKESLDLNPSIYGFNTRCFFRDVGIL